MKNALEYILNPEKTEMGTLTGGNHILPDADFAFEKMLETKKTMEEKYGRKKTEGRQGYHYVLSFSPKDNVTPEMAMEITKKFIEAHIPDYESVYAVHTDKKHLHSHVVFNSVSMVNGLKYHYKNGDWAKIIQPITNRLCEEYGLSTIKLEDWDDKKKEPSKNQNYSEWQAQAESEAESEKQGKPKKPKPELVQEDIWECLNLAESRQEFDLEMQKRGYEVNRKGTTGADLKHTSVLPPGGKQNKRLKEEQEKILKSLPETKKKKIKKKQHRVNEKQEKKNYADDDKETMNENTVDMPVSFEENKNNVRDKMDKDGMDIEENKEQKEEKHHKIHPAPFIRSAKMKPVKSANAEKISERADETCSFVPKKETVLVVRTMTAAFILDDYSKRRKGKYYHEYVKFDTIQKKVKYLHGNHISTMKQLEKRLEELYSLREKLADRKKEIFRERRKYVKIFRFYETLEKLRIPAQLYCDGDQTFSGEYEQLKNTLAELKKSGMTVEGIKKQYDSFREKLSSMGKTEYMLQKEIKLCEDIKQESIQKQRQIQKQKEYIAKQEKSRSKEKSKNKSR